MRFAILFGLLSACGIAQVRPQLMEEAGRENLPSQKLGIDDLVAVSVYDAPELTRTVRVEADGTIHLPMLTDGVKAAGLFPRDVEGALVEALKTEQILVDPVVKVTVAEYHSRPISVMGAVRKPLTFQAVGAVTLLDALARAEGLSQDAGTEVLVSRPQPSPDSRGEVTSTLVERIPLNRLLKDADPAVNYQLHGGEEIRVPEAGKIFVLGNVKKPGAFAVHDAGDNSVLKMVALSEGVLPYASKQAYIYRRDANGDKREIAVEFDKIMQRKAPDMALQVDDVLYIPDNKSRRNTANVIDRITGFGASTASGILIWH
ncbi:MAG TPA: polysaccharide biosynthesis/export family protein [Bryobacteraceae bacterium]|nr:polysaccharide biosynthesis/export family protein [Bryobacteraceae bacterium]